MGTLKFSGYTHRFLARLVIEAKTPLAVGSGEKDVITDALVTTDVNGLPYIPGTSIAGVVKHMLEQKGYKTDVFFGFQKENDGCGSEIIFTEAKILNSKGEVIDGLNLNATDDDLLKFYTKLPIRQHVRINDKGVADKAGKFDEQVVFAGTRFCFEMEMVAKNADEESNFNKALEQIQDTTFRIGSGTRCGFGEIKVVELYKRSLDLNQPDDLKLYLSKSSNLSIEWSGWEKPETENESKAIGWIKYELCLQPEDFFLFGSGFGDDEADMTPVKERKVDWSTGSGTIIEDCVLIPATSVKGALAHRVAFHYNRLMGRFAGCKGEKEPKVGNENEAVQALFGYESQDENKQLRGNVLFSDVIENKQVIDKILNHVSIDRFTGGAIEGALFSEKTTYLTDDDKFFSFVILAKKDVLEKDEKIKQAFECALKDIVDGTLPLGGGVNRGNGCFGGSVKEIDGTFNHKRVIESW